jgi:hypothetical protein
MGIIYVGTGDFLIFFRTMVGGIKDRPDNSRVSVPGSG